MGGTIDLESEYGKGTKAFFNIPFLLPSSQSVVEKQAALLIGAELSDRLQTDTSVSWRGSNASENSPRLDPTLISGLQQGSPAPIPEARSRTASVHSQLGDRRVNRSSIDGGETTPLLLPSHSQSKFPIANGDADLKNLMPVEVRPQFHVLVVEDNPINQKIAITIVKKLGFTVSAAWNGKV